MTKGNKDVAFSVFTKPWKELSVSALGRLISGFGFDGIEFPLRTGYQVEPENAEKGLIQLVNQLADYGLKIYSVASGTNENIFSACAEAGIPLIRIMVRIDPAEGYMNSIEKARQNLEKLLPLCEKYKVKVGIQQHYGNNIADSAGLLHLVEKFDPNHICAIWDAGHDALAGQQPEYGLDIVWSHLAMVNLKNAYYYRATGPEAEAAEWKRHWTTGPHGLASWPRVIQYLKKRNYEGAICFTAEYHDERNVDLYIQQDIAYARKLYAEGDTNE